ncbi:MAG: glycosyltransferase family 2 protein [Alphaproteobacteria bacterium]|nr:glycosyltransferase family 2 protein [Alphaproteobacteria bacterium]
MAVHYDGVVDDATLHRGLGSLQAQTFRDFEVLLYHDGPPRRPLRSDDLVRRCDRLTRVTATERRYADWGHSLRDRGIREARGDYIVHFNVDNILYPFALGELDRELRSLRPVFFSDDMIAVFDPADIVVFPILMRGMGTNGHVAWRHRANVERLLGRVPAMIMTGLPPRPGNIDCMQLVMRRTTWLAEGGWTDRSERSDGKLYEGLVARYGAKHVTMVLGEHW